VRLKPFVNLWQHLTEPVVELTNADDRIRARFLAQLFLLAALLFGIVLSLRYLLVPDVPQIPLRLLVAWLGAGAIVMPYFIVRRGQIFIAGMVLIIHIMLIIIAQLMLSMSGIAFQTTLTFMLVVILFASHFHSIQLTVIAAILQLLLLCILPFIIPVFTISDMLRGPVPVHLVLSSMIILFSFYRGKIEAAQRELLLESEARFKMVSDFIPNYAFSIQVSPNGAVKNEWVTDEFARITGYSLADANSDVFGKLFHPDDLPRYLESIEQTYRGLGGSGEYRIYTKSGELRWLRISRNVIWDNDTNRLARYYGVAQDITAQKQVASKQLNSAVEDGRLKLVRDFVTAFSHDFRTSLATIETSRYLAEHLVNTARADAAIEKLHSIRRSVNHMSAQLENLNALATLGILKREPCDLHRLIDEVIALHIGKARQNNQLITFEPLDTQLVVTADANEISRALRELLRNALSFTPVGGKVTLRTALTEDDLQISIEDNGVGIAPEHHEKIFELFYRVDSARGIDSGGVGLGLSVAKMIVTAHGGKISLSSTPKSGSTFTIHLPLDD